MSEHEGGQVVSTPFLERRTLHRAGGLALQVFQQIDQEPQRVAREARF